jgi:superfamily I DNA/RNA helicase
LPNECSETGSHPPRYGQPRHAGWPKPRVCHFETVADEQEFVLREIVRLISEEGVMPQEIGVLHSENYVLDRYRDIVPAAVRRFEIRRQTGLEYRAVFIPQIQDMDHRTVGLGLEEDQARQAVKFYSAMTRARTWLYLTHEQKWPKVLDAVLPLHQWRTARERR